MAPPPTPSLELCSQDGEPLECTMILAAFAASSGSMTLAAARIGWTRQKLRRRMLALGLRAETSFPMSRTSP